MAIILKQSTQIKVRIGPFVDATDGVTPETGITLGAADQAEALKADGAATVDISAATWAAIAGADGWYDLTLTTSHTDTIGELIIVVQDSSVCLPVFARFQVVEEDVYQDIYQSSAGAIGQRSLQNNHLHRVFNAAVSGPNVTDFSLAAYLVSKEVTADWDDFDNTTDSLQAIRDRLDTLVPNVLNTTALGNIGIDWANVENPSTAVDLAGTDIQLCDTITTYTGNTVQTGDSFARLGAPAGASVSADIATVDTNVDSILSDTGTDGVIVASFTAAGKAEINTEAADVLSTDTQALPGQEAPSATPTLATAIMYLYKSWRNKWTHDGTDAKLFADDGTTVDQKHADSESGGTVTKGEVGTGP